MAERGAVSHAVLRFPASWLAEGLVPMGLEGLWVEVPDPRTVSYLERDAVLAEIRAGAVALRPSGRFEAREDGAVAEVWSVEELVEP